MARKRSAETKMVKAAPVEDLDSLTSAEIRDRINQIDDDTKRGVLSNEDAKKALKKALHVAQYREREAAKPAKVELNEDQRAWLRECNKDRAQKRARVGAINRQIQDRKQELTAYRRQRNAIVGDTWRLEERRDPKTREMKRVKIKVPGAKKPGTDEPMPTEWDSKIAELEGFIAGLERDLAIAQQRLAEAVEAEEKARRGA